MVATWRFQVRGARPPPETFDRLGEFLVGDGPEWPVVAELAGKVLERAGVGAVGGGRAGLGEEGVDGVAEGALGAGDRGHLPGAPAGHLHRLPVLVTENPSPLSLSRAQAR
jgi:hypothetical protein